MVTSGRIVYLLTLNICRLDMSQKAVNRLALRVWATVHIFLFSTVQKWSELLLGF